MQETLHFDPVSGRISSLRSKEEAHDYRYFPEPDLVPIVPTPEMLETARAGIPELPAEREARYEPEFALRRRHRAPVRVRARPGALLRARRGRDRHPARPTGSRSCAPGSAPTRPTSPVVPETLAKLVDLAAAARSPPARPARCSTRWSRPGRPGRDRRGRGPDRDGGQRRAGGDRGQGDRREPGRRRAHQGRQRQGDGRAGRPDHARDQGPRRRRRGQPPASQCPRL